MKAFLGRAKIIRKTALIIIMLIIVTGSTKTNH